MKTLDHWQDGRIVLIDRDAETIQVVSDSVVLHNAIQAIGQLADGEGEIEYLICSGVDDHGSHVVELSTPSILTAVDRLVKLGPGTYLTAVRP
jgi:hypothetical protein